LTAINWPSSLPTGEPESQGWSRRLDDNVVRYPVEVGAPKRRRRSTAADYLVSAAFQLTTEQLETFWAFYRDTLVDGVHAFNMIDPVTRENAVYQFEGDDGPVESHVSDGIWRIACSLRQFA